MIIINRNQKKLFRIVIVIIFILIVSGGLFFINQSLVPQGYVLNIDEATSDTAKEEINNFLSQIFKDTVSLSEIRKCLESAYPILLSTSSRLMPKKIIEIYAQSDDPFLIINNTIVLTVHKKIGTVDWYKYYGHAHHIESPQFDTHDSQQWVQDFFDFFSYLQPSIYEHFSITAFNKFYIKLSDLKDKNWCLICSVHNRLTEKILEDYKRIKKENCHIPGEKYVDMRFKDMLIFGREKLHS